MNTKIVRYILCRMLGVEAALLLVPVLVAVIYQEKCGIVFLIPIVILCLLFLVAGRKRPEHGQIYGKEGMVIVALAWILWSLFGAMPFTLSGYIPSYVDAFFETVQVLQQPDQVLSRMWSIAPLPVVLAELYPLDRRYGSTGFCACRDISGQKEFHASDACGSAGT